MDEATAPETADGWGLESAEGAVPSDPEMADGSGLAVGLALDVDQTSCKSFNGPRWGPFPE